MKNLENTPKIYVGTYGMYNNGSLFGKWFDLTNYSDREKFYKDCYEYHRNEFDPELMFQDWEYIPDFLISESWLHENALKYLKHFHAILAVDNVFTQELININVRKSCETTESKSIPDLI